METLSTPPATDTDDRAAARAEWHASGGTLTGRQLADRYNRPPKWGQRRRAEAMAEAGDRTPSADTPPVRPAVTADRPPVRPADRPVTRRRTPAGRTTAVRRVTAVAVALVAAVAAATSYSHMHHLAVEAGEAELVALVLPLSVDGLVVAATMTLLSARRSGRTAGALPWLALMLGLGASLAANVAAAEPTVVGRLVAAWPPVALALSFELLLRQTRGER